MIEVFITNIMEVYQAENTIKELSDCFLDLEITYDMDETGLHFPCGHTVIRIKSFKNRKIQSENIMGMVNKMGYKCQIMPESICV